MPGANDPVQHSHVLLQAQGFDFAVDAADTLEVFSSTAPLTQMPRHDRRILGAVSYRRRSLPVTSIGRWHGVAEVDPASAADRPMICVLQHGTRRIGLQVTQVSRVRRSPASAVERLCHAANGEIFNRTLSVDDALWPILDVPTLLEVSQAWSGAAASTPVEESANGCDGPGAEPLAVFAVGPEWYAVPASRALQVARHGHVQPVGSGNGQLAGAVAWRSHILPLVRLQGTAVRRAQSGTDLMLVVLGRRVSAAGKSNTAVAIQIDAVDRVHRPSRREPSPVSGEPLAWRPEAACVRLGDGRFVTLIDPDALALEFAFAWSSPGSSMFEPALAAESGLPGRAEDRNAQAYLVYRDAEHPVAFALSCVDEVLAPGDDGSSTGKPADGTMVWRDQRLPVVALHGSGPSASGQGCGAVVVARSGPRRYAMKVASVEFIIPAGAAQLSAISLPGRGREEFLTAAIDGVRRSFRISQ